MPGVGTERESRKREMEKQGLFPKQYLVFVLPGYRVQELEFT